MTINHLVEWVALVVAIEAVAEIVSEAEAFRPIRERLARAPGALGWYLGGLLSCGYCLSVWLAAAAALAAPGRLLTGPETWWVVADFMVKIFVLHRASNIWHALVSRWTGNKPFLMSLAMMGRPPEVQAPVAEPRKEV